MATRQGFIPECAGCRYNLSGSPDIGDCPECGRGYDKNSEPGNRLAVYREPEALAHSIMFILAWLPVIALFICLSTLFSLQTSLWSESRNELIAALTLAITGLWIGCSLYHGFYMQPHIQRYRRSLYFAGVGTEAGKDTSRYLFIFLPAVCFACAEMILASVILLHLIISLAAYLFVLKSGTLSVRILLPLTCL